MIPLFSEPGPRSQNVDLGEKVKSNFSKVKGAAGAENNWVLGITTEVDGLSRPPG